MDPISAHPNPQFARSDWQSLNGEWDFYLQPASKLLKNRFLNVEHVCAACRQGIDFSKKITVPFCPQSSLSGIGYTDFIAVAAYRKTVKIQKDGRRVFLHIGAADYLTTVLVNGEYAGVHYGGYTSFSCDITDLIIDDENEIIIHCQDNEKDPFICRGKQCEKRHSQGCDYTRTTGIWQSVYLEFTPPNYIKDFRIHTDYQSGRVTIDGQFEGAETFSAEVLYEGNQVAEAQGTDGTLTLIPAEIHLWEAGHGRLYDLVLHYGNDTVYTYFGIRSVAMEGMRFLLNGKSVFQRLVLDQGFYKDGIYTAKDDGELIRDIELSLSLGFNGARLHQKVFDPRFLYYCDKYGYLVWGEYANWGLDYSREEAAQVFIREWREALARDINHPSVIGWCPFNETWDYGGRRQRDSLLEEVYAFTKAFDPSRPCIDTSGNFHVKTDIFDLHDYRYDPDEVRRSYDRFVTEGYLYQHVLQENEGRQTYRGEPVFISEYGGIKWETDSSHPSWGYGTDVRTPEEFFARYRGLTEALLFNRKFFGFCYTQLYDIEQEQNGLFTYERKPKFPETIYQQINAVNTQQAAIEQEG